MIVLDASILIAHLDDRDAHHTAARALLEASGDEPLGASTMSVAETLVAPARAGRLEDARAALARLGVEELAFGDGTAGRLAQLRAETARKLPDCCVILAAEQHGGTVASFDTNLLKVARERGLGTVA